MGALRVSRHLWLYRQLIFLTKSILSWEHIILIFSSANCSSNFCKAFDDRIPRFVKLDPTIYSLIYDDKYYFIDRTYLTKWYRGNWYMYYMDSLFWHFYSLGLQFSRSSTFYSIYSMKYQSTLISQSSINSALVKDYQNTRSFTNFQLFNRHHITFLRLGWFGFFDFESQLLLIYIKFFVF